MTATKRPPRGPRRRRCNGPCHELYPLDKLTRIEPKVYLCGDCITQEALAEAPPEESPESPDPTSDSGDSGGGGPDDATLAAPPDIPAPSVQIDLDRLDPPKRDYSLLPRTKPDGWPLRWGSISPSGLATFLRCPEQFRRKNILGLREPYSGAGLSGTAIHDAVARAYRYKIQEDGILPPALAVEAYHRSFSRGLAENGGAKEIDWGFSGKAPNRKPLDENAVRFRGVPAVESYITKILPQMQPVAVEKMFVIPIPGVPVPMLGFIDLVTTRSLVDLKFGGKRDSKITPDGRVQAMMYMRAEALDFCWHSMSWKGEYRTPSDAPGLVMERTAERYHLAGELARSLVQAILAYADRFGTDQPWPGNITHQWACDSCYFREHGCAWWNPTLAPMALSLTSGTG